MASLLAFGIVTSFILVFPVDSLKIHINTSQELENYLCNNQSLPIPDVIFELNSSNYIISSGDFCNVSKFQNVTLQSKSSNQINITCIRDDYPHPTRGLAFINCTVTFRQVTFINCGTYLPDNFTRIVNSSSLYYTSTHAAALLFIQCRVIMSEVELTSSYGFAVIGINLVDSILYKVYVSSSLSSEVYNKDNKSIGSGVLLHFLDTLSRLTTSTAIKDSKFLYNIDVFNGSCITDVYYNSVQSKKPFHVVHAAGLTILYTQQHFKANVLIERTTFSNNIGSSSGALLILHYNTGLKNSSTAIQNSQFEKNANWLYCHGAALQFYWFVNNAFGDYIKRHPLIVANTQFTEHLGIVKDKHLKNQSTGAMYIGIVNQAQSSLAITFRNSAFHNNMVTSTGACLFASVYQNVGSVGDVSITLDNITAYENSQDILFPTVSNAGIFSFYDINKIIIKGDSDFKRNCGSVIHAVDSNVYLNGHMTFTENRSTRGAAIKLEGKGHLYLMNGTNASFKHNHATKSGGAIFIKGWQNSNCSIQIDDACSGNETRLVFSDNEAKHAGNSIFASNIFSCYMKRQFICKAMSCYNNHFKFLNHQNKELLNLSTNPAHLIMEFHNNTKINTTVTVKKYPGQIFTIRLAAVDGAGRYVHSTIDVALACKMNGNTICSNIVWLSREQNEMDLFESSSNTSTPINISIHTKSNNTVDGILIFSLPLYPATHTLNFKLLPCPLGFTLNNKSGSCDCSPAFNTFHRDNVIECSIDRQTITRPVFTTNSWIGPTEVKHQTECGISLDCPLGHCSNNKAYQFIRIKSTGNVTSSFLTNGFVNSNEPLCLHNREGPLCGKCKEVDGHQYSNVFGSPECKECSNLWLLTILLYVFLGLLFVYLLYALRLTLTTGTLNGIIFFAQAANCGLLDLLNTVQYYFDNPALNYTSRFCTIFLYLINLRLDFSLCLFNGMNEIYKKGLLLFPPFFFLVVVLLVIIISHLSLRFSNKLSHFSVQVLVTIVHLSFSSLLRIISDVFTSTTIYTAQNQYKVWYWDGTVEYMGHSHSKLVIVSLIMVIPLLLPYIILLLFGKSLIRHFSLANKYLRPLYEAIHAPYKEHKQYWFVARLLLLVFMYLVFAFYRTLDINALFIYTTPLLLTFLVLQSFMMPFKNKLITYLDSWIMFLLTFVYTTVWYYLQIHNKVHYSSIICVVAVCVVFLTFIVVFIGHILWVTGHIYKLKSKFNAIKNRISKKLIFAHSQNTNDIVPLRDSNDSYYGSCSQYREPILSPNP